MMDDNRSEVNFRHSSEMNSARGVCKRNPQPPTEYSTREDDPHNLELNVKLEGDNPVEDSFSSFGRQEGLNETKKACSMAHVNRPQRFVQFQQDARSAPHIVLPIERSISRLDRRSLNRQMSTDFSFKITSGLSQRTFYVHTEIEPHNGETVPVLSGLDNPGEDQDGLPHKLKEAVAEGHWSVQFSTTIAAAFLTYSLVNQGAQLNHQIATMMVIVLVGASHPQLIAAAACGAFAGGQYKNTVPSYAWLLLLSNLAASAWLAVQRFKLLLGYSGRLGSTTFLAMNLTMVLFMGPTSAVRWSQYGRTDMLWGEVLKVETSLVFLACVVFTAGVAGFFRLRAEVPVNPVLLPVKFAFLFMMIMNATDYEYRNTCYDGFAVGAYVAMASEMRLPTFVSFASAGLFAGLWGIMLVPFFRGFGGKGGFTATLGFLTYSVVSTLFQASLKGLQRVPEDPKSKETERDDTDGCLEVNA